MAKIRTEDGRRLSTLEEVRTELAAMGIRLDHRPTGDDPRLWALLEAPSLSDSQKEEVLRALDGTFDDLERTAGYQSRDLIVLHAGVPDLDTLLAKFDRCHRHADDEVRTIVDGEGVFGFVGPDGHQLELLIEAGDYINVPAGTEHWFHLTGLRRMEVAAAGLDVIKDDEILCDLPGAPVLERLRACRRVLEDLERRTGRTVLYAVNVTGTADRLIERARLLVREGANALLVNVLCHGVSVMEALARDPGVGVPLFAHPALAGALCAAPDHGLSYGVLLGTLMAHTGADAALYPAHYGSLPFAATEERRIRDALRGRGVLPVPSAGIHPGIIPRVLADYGHDVALNAGTGIMDHPDGPAAGVRAFFEALDRHRQGLPFAPDQIPAGPLRRAVERWGHE